MSGTATRDAAVAALARAAVERAAPEELPLFRATSEAYFEDPASIGRGGREAMLGFGVEAAVVLVTPVALEVAKDVLGWLRDQLAARAGERGEAALDWVAAKLGAEPQEDAAADETASLSHEQLEQVRALALEKAKQLRLPDAKAELLADSLVGSLATT
jgi:hypothetical protein